MPIRNKSTGIDEWSVYITSNIESSEIWEIGDKYAGVGRGKQAKARAIFSVKKIKEGEGEGLRIEPETSLHRLHANIVNWPNNNSLQKNIAQELKKKAEIDIRNIS